MGYNYSAFPKCHIGILYNCYGKATPTFCLTLKTELPIMMYTSTLGLHGQNIR